MKRVKLISLTLALSLVCVAAQAQFGKRLGDAVQRSAENTTIRKAEQKTEQAVSKTIDKATDPKTYKKQKKQEKKQEKKQKKQGNQGTPPTSNAAPKQAKAAEMAYTGSKLCMNVVVQGRRQSKKNMYS